MAHGIAKQTRTWFLTAGVVGAVGLIVDFMPSEKLIGRDIGAAGFSMIILAIIAAIIGMSQLRPSAHSDVGLGEKKAMVSLAATALLGAYFIVKMHDIGGETDVSTRLLAKITGVMIAIWIATRICFRILRDREGDNTLEDERDQNIRRQATSAAYAFLQPSLLVSAILIIFAKASWMPWVTPAIVAIHIIGLTIGAELARHITAIALHRRYRA